MDLSMSVTATMPHTCACVWDEQLQCYTNLCHLDSLSSIAEVFTL